MADPKPDEAPIPDGFGTAGAAIKQGLFAGRWFTRLSPEQVIILFCGVLLAAILAFFGVLFYDSRADKIEARHEANDTILQLRRDNQDEREKQRDHNAKLQAGWQEHERALVADARKNCQEQEKNRRAESQKHMTEAFDQLRALEKAITQLNTAITKLRGGKVEIEPETVVAPAPKLKGPCPVVP